MWVYLYSLTMSASNSGCGPGEFERRRPTNLYILSSWSLILFSRRPRLLLPRSYPVRHLTSYIDRWSIDHYQNDYTELLFLQCGYSLSLSLPPGLHQISFSPTPCSFGDHIICFPRLYEDDIYLKSNLFLVNNNMVTDHFHFKRQKHVLVLV